MYLSLYYKLKCASFSAIYNAREAGQPSHGTPMIAIYLGTQPSTFRSRNNFRRYSATKFHQTRLLSGLENVGECAKSNLRATVGHLLSRNSNNLSPSKSTADLWCHKVRELHIPQPIRRFLFILNQYNRLGNLHRNLFYAAGMQNSLGHAYFVRQNKLHQFS
jgi:hypothetical protein